MTALVGASVLLIAASAIALVTGWVTADESLIWTSIGASVGAAVALALAFFRARQGDTGMVPVDAPGPEAAPAEPDASTVAETVPPSEPQVRTRPQPRAKPTEPEPEAEPEPTTRPARKPAASRTGPRDAAVAGVPGRKKFHRTDCRYAAAKTARSMTRADALGEGYEPCAICKP